MQYQHAQWIVPVATRERREEDAAEVIAQQLERLVRADIAPERKQAILRALLSTVTEELDSEHARRDPRYDAVLRHVLGERDTLASCVAPHANEHAGLVVTRLLNELVAEDPARDASVTVLLASGTD